ncbi:MAG TPA: hypothetical protein VFD15_06405 [Clostridia bacterium]|nr:hypothetical protein [Clostridia bacterium]
MKTANDTPEGNTTQASGTRGKPPSDDRDDMSGSRQEQRRETPAYKKRNYIEDNREEIDGSENGLPYWKRTTYRVAEGRGE